VVGAGFAGLRAARDLAERGRAVIVLEARDRVGGRAYSVKLGPQVAELGGSWFTPEQREVRAELERYGQPIRDSVLPRHARWRTAGELRDGLPVPWEEVGALEHALQRIASDAASRAVGAGPAPRSGAEYIEALDPPPATRDFLVGWWQLMAGAPPEIAAVSELLATIAAHGGLTGLITCLAHSPEQGWSSLAEAIVAASGISLRLATPASSVHEDGEVVAVDTTAGDTVRASAAIVAVPVNCLPSVVFTPPLPAPVQAAAGRNVGCATKLVLLLKDVPPHGLAVGHDPTLPLRWWWADEALDGLTLVIGFGWQDDSFDPENREQVARAVAGYFPEATLVDYAQHDWNADPWSSGTWLTAPADPPDLFEPSRFGLPGRVVLAGSDVATDEAGWIEGAFRSGAAAASRAALILDGG
jgi:monoamine oxidase